MKKAVIAVLTVIAVGLLAVPAMAIEIEGSADSITAWSQVDISPWWNSDETANTPDKVVDGDVGTVWNSSWYDTWGTGGHNGTWNGSYGPAEGYPGWFRLTWPVTVYVASVRIDWGQNVGGDAVYVVDAGDIYADTAVTGAVAAAVDGWATNPYSGVDIMDVIDTPATKAGGTLMGSWTASDGSGEPLFVTVATNGLVTSGLTLWFPMDDGLGGPLLQEWDTRIAELTIEGGRLGDTDLNGNVDGVDLATLGLNWNPGGPGGVWAEGDFDLNGNVDGVDLATLGLNWAPGGYAIAGPVPTPEPATLALMGLGIGLLLRRKR
jgi:hypothetical protein